MLEEGTAYKCYCSKERLEALREEQMAKGEKDVYKRQSVTLTRSVFAIAPSATELSRVTTRSVSYTHLIPGITTGST